MQYCLLTSLSSLISLVCAEWCCFFFVLVQCAITIKVVTLCVHALLFFTKAILFSRLQQTKRFSIPKHTLHLMQYAKNTRMSYCNCRNLQHVNKSSTQWKIWQIERAAETAQTDKRSSADDSTFEKCEIFFVLLCIITMDYNDKKCGPKIKGQCCDEVVSHNLKHTASEVLSKSCSP